MHRPMKSYSFKIFTLIVLSVAFIGYSFIIYFENIPEIAPANNLAQQGKILWQEKNCTSCHQFYGLGGHLGPDLTNVADKRPEEYIRAILQSGTLVMPNFNLSEQELDALIAFLKYTNTTGKSNPTAFKQNSNGTIEQ